LYNFDLNHVLITDWKIFIFVTVKMGAMCSCVKKKRKNRRENDKILNPLIAENVGHGDSVVECLPINNKLVDQQAVNTELFVKVR